MGDLGKRIARVDVLIGGVDQAKKQVDQMEEKVKSLRKAVEAAKVKMDESVDTINFTKAQEEYEELKKQLQRSNKELQATKLNIETVKSYLTDISGQTLRNLNQAKKALNQMLQRVKPSDVKGLDTVRGFIKQLGDEALRRKGNLIEFKDVISNIGTVSDQKLAGAKKRLEELVAITDKNEAALKKYQFQLKMVQEEEQKRVAQSAKKVMGNLPGSSVAEIREAVKATEMLRDAQSRGSKEWSRLNQQIQDATHYLDEFTRRAVRDDMSDRFKRLSESSTASLAEQKKYWQQLADETKNNTAALNIYLDKVKAIREEEQKRVAQSADKVMNNLSGSSVAEIREAVKATEMLRDAQTRGSDEWEYYATQIQDANGYLDEYAKADKWAKMEESFKNLQQLSANSFEQQKKYWQDMVAGADRGSKELKEYEMHLQEIARVEKTRNIAKVRKVMGDMDAYSTEEIKETIKLLEQLRDKEKPGNRLWTEASEGIKTATEYLKKYTKAQQEAKVAETMRTIITASRDAMEEAKKYWQEQINGASLTNPKLAEYKKNLEDIRREETARATEGAKTKIQEVKSGNFKGTIAETKEAIKLMEAYKQTLSVIDADGLKEVNETIEALNKQLDQSRTSTLSFEESIKAAKKVAKGTFSGTLEDVEKLKKQLLELRGTLKVSETDKIKKIDKALKQVGNRLEGVQLSAEETKKILGNIKTASLEKLKAVAAQLQKQLESTNTHSKKFIIQSAKLRQVNERIREVNRSWEKHDNQIKATIKRLASYVMVYAGFNEVWGFIKKVAGANLELSDSLADIRKTTGMTAESVAELSKAIDSLDTRTAQKELHDLAYEAGKLGLKTQNEVMSFVKAGNQVIAALGEDLGGAEAVRSLMKINDLLGETSRLGVEKALLATGSAINELSQNSTASAGPIADIVARLGAVGDQAKLTMADLIAFGGTADELSQDAEVVGTAVSKFITALQTNTHSIAQAIGIDDKSLEQLMEGGKMMDAILVVLRRVGQMGGLRAIDPIMKEFGSDGERLERVMMTLGNNVDVLERRVRMSNEAFREATSVTNEYNIKNESSMAVVERMSNTFKEFFVNSAREGMIHKFLLSLSSVPSVIERNIKAFKALISVITGLTTALVLNRIEWLRVAQAMGPKQVGKALLSMTGGAAKALFSLKSLTNGVKALGKALSGNWLTLAAGAIAALGMAYWRFSTYVSDAAKAQAEHTAALEKEQMEVEALFNGLKNANTTTEERIKLIDQINDKYGAYLGYMVRESDNADKIAASQELINAKIRERIALQLKEKMNSSTTEKYADLFRDSLTGISSSFEKAKGITSARSQSALNMVQDIVDKQITEPMDKILLAVKQKLQATFDVEKGPSYGASAYFDIQGDLKDYIQAHKDFRAELKTTDEFVKKETELTNEKTVEATRKVLNAMVAEYNKYQKEISSAKTDAAKDAAKSKALQTAKDYINKAKSIKNLLPTESLKELNERIETFEKNIASLTPKAEKFISVWGDGKSLDTASPTDLVKKYKELFDERMTLRKNADYNTIYSKQFADRKEAMKWYMDQLDAIKKKLNEMGYNEHGGFLKGKGGRKGPEKEIKEQVNAAMAALEAWYNREQQLITRSYIEREITEEEYHHRSLDKEKEFLLDRIKLRKKLLKQPGGESFDQKKYVHKDEDTGEATEYFKGKDLDKLGTFLKKFGEGMTDGIFKQLTEDELTIFNRTVEHINKIQKIILDNDFTGQVDKQYQDELEELDLFWSRYEEVSDDTADYRLDALKELAKESYFIESDGLRERMEKNAEFSDWIIGRTGQDYEALLIMLRKYYDDMEEAENREIARKQRISDKNWKKDGIKGAWGKAEDDAENNAEFAHNLQDMGILDQGSVDDAEVALYRTRLEAAQAYYEYIRENGGDLEAAEEKRQEAMTRLQEAEMEATSNKMDILQRYTDAVVDFSEQMGEAAFGEVEDRKAAAKQLLKTTMRITKDLIMEQVKRLVMKRTMNQREISLEQSKDAAISMTHGVHAVTDLTVEGAKTVGGTAMGIAQGSAKTIGQLGWWGIPLIAVISAALSALMGLAMGKMNKAKKEVQAATGASSSKGRIAAGMLTYAKGDYPVLGNDGKVYNATYHDKLQTGVYKGGNGRAHFGIFSEKEPEMIVDGKTTRKIIVDYPHLYESILTIANHGRLRESAMPTFAEGNLPVVQRVVQTAVPAGNEELSQTLMSLNDTVQQLKSRLDKPINAVVDPYGRKGAVHQMRKAENFMRQTGQMP